MFLLLMAIITLVIAILMVPTVLGIISVSPDSNFGLLLVIMTLQIMVLGETPVGERNRTWLLIMAGLFFAGFGMVSCFIPGLLSGIIVPLLGIWNLIAGGYGLVTLLLPIVQGIRHPPAEPNPIPSFIIIIISGVFIMTIMFGVNLLLPGFLPILIIPGILFVLGFLLAGLAFFQTIAPAEE
jgi:hypothetical protein